MFKNPEVAGKVPEKFARWRGVKCDTILFILHTGNITLRKKKKSRNYLVDL